MIACWTYCSPKHNSWQINMWWPSLVLPIAWLLFLFPPFGNVKEKWVVLLFQASSWSLDEPWEQQGGCSPAFLCESKVQLSPWNSPSPLAGLSGQSCSEGCRVVRSTIRSSEQALSGRDEPGQSTQRPASQLPLPEQGGSPTALCLTRVHAHKEHKVAKYLIVLYGYPHKAEQLSL